MDIKNKICIRCNEEIFKEQRAVQLKTFQDDEIIEDIYFHLTCFKLWHEEKAIEKSKNQMKKLINTSLNIAKNFGGDGIYQIQ